MFIGRTKSLMATVTLVALLILFTPFVSDESSAEYSRVGTTDIHYVIDISEPVCVSAGYEGKFKIILSNEGSSNQVVSLSVTGPEYLGLSFSDSGPFSITSNSVKEITMYLEAGRYLTADSYTVSVTIHTFVPSEESESFDVKVNVTSGLTSDRYNKFFGIFDNRLDGALGNVWFTAVVSFLGLLAIGYAAAAVAVPLCVRLVLRKNDVERKPIEKLLFGLCQLLIWFWVIGQVFRILGAGESIIDLINKLFSVAYVIVGVVVGWQLYKLVVDAIIRRSIAKADEYEMESKRLDFESFRPLFMYLGEIFIGVAVVMVVMNLLGFDLGAIITSAGLVSLGISMGAQDVLKQFFAGLQILATRPFKAGDIIKIGSDSTVFVVKKVNVMNTYLANWDNTDINIMPNSAITTSKIQNMTRETRLWKVYMQVQVSFSTDVELARNLVMDAVCQNPHVITDGSVSRPYTRLDDIGGDNMVIKTGFTIDDYNAQYSVAGQIRQDILKKFAENGVDIDYGKVIIHEAGPGAPGKVGSRGTDDA